MSQASRSRTLVLEFAKRPVPGRVKTRLARTEGPREAARIYRLLAEAVHAVLRAAQARGEADVVVCLPPEDLAQDAGDWLPGARHRWSQGAGDLGQRLARGFEMGMAAYDHVFAVGTDVVGLDAHVLSRARAALTEADVVLAPTPDGGYGLIGLRRESARAHLGALFGDMPWSTARVTAITRGRARAVGLTVHEIEGLRDVDVAADLAGVLPTLAVLVPVYDEAPRIAQNLGPLMAQAQAHGSTVEVIVADGGSTDGSAAVARRLGARVLETARGRGTQLAEAADAARARWLWTLHADAGIQPDAVATVLAWCARSPHPWGACPSRFVHPAPFLRLMECITDGRPRVLRTPYGDQGLVVKRSAYEAVGGYRRIPLMEDVELARALRFHPGPGRVPTPLAVDARRWRHHGMLGTTLRNLWTLVRWRVLGVDAATLAADYSRGEGDGGSADTLCP